MRADLCQTFVVRVGLAQIATLALVVAGIRVLAGGLGALYWVVAGMVFSTLVALFEACGCSSWRSTARSSLLLLTTLFTLVSGR